MGRIVEREEGLFTRNSATRILCMVAALGWIAITAIALTIIFVATRLGQEPIPAAGRFVMLAFWVLVASAAATGILVLWRRCDRCRRRLFAQGGNAIFARTLNRPENRGWLEGLWRTKGLTEPERDYRAKTFLGSYQRAAIMQMALTGRLRCQWCGHEDGGKPEYVVTSSQ